MKFQFLMKYFIIFAIEVFQLISSHDGPVECPRARARCLHRQSCRNSLMTFASECSIAAVGNPGKCSVGCRNALVSLLSSDEGEDLYNCDCVGNGMCTQFRERMEICREDVLRILHPNSTISCSAAEFICLGDAACSTALQFYQKFCRKMFDGESCSFQCKNSLEVLLRQEKALKLRSCYCDGREAYACSTVQANMAAMCFNSPPKTSLPNNLPGEEITSLVPFESENDDDTNEIIQLEREDFSPRPRYTHIILRRPMGSLSSSSSGQPVLFIGLLPILLHLPLFYPLNPRAV